MSHNQDIIRSESSEIDLLISEEPIQSKKRHTFSLGQSYSLSSSTPKRRKVIKSKKTKSNKKLIKSQEEPKVIKEPKEQINEMIDLFQDVNPYYVNARVHYKVFNKEKEQQVCFSKPTPKPAHIKIILPQKTQTPDEFYAYHQICNRTGSFFDWQIILGYHDLTGPFFSYPKSTFKFKQPQYLKTKQAIYKEMDQMFYYNQWLRWQFKRIVRNWLDKKSQNRLIGAESDLVTGEPIKPEEQITITSIKNRTRYIFSGHVLLKTAKTCLEGQVASIPHVKVPHNPYTNTPFSIGELIHLYREVVAYCGKKGRPVPAILALYRENKFRHHLLLKINHNYLQMKATESYMLNDDTRGEFFIETMETLLEDFEVPLALEFDSFLISYQRFRLWNEIEPKHYLIACWKKLASDYWYYKQTEHLAREYWRSEASIFQDVVLLLNASFYKLHEIQKEYYKRRRQQQQQQN